MKCDVIMNPESLTNLQILYLMDDSLSLNLTDLLKFFQISNFHLLKEDLIKVKYIIKHRLFQNHNFIILTKKVLLLD